MASPLAAAHLTVNEEAQSAFLGERFLYFSTSPNPVYAGDDYLLTLAVSGTDYQPSRDLAIRGHVDGFAFDLSESAPGTYVASLHADAKGTKTVDFDVPAVNGTTVRWNATVNIYPDLGIAVVPANATADQYAGEPTDLGVVVQDRDTGAPDPRVTDVRLRLERWTDDHKTMLGAQELNATLRDGVWWTRPTFEEAGMVHVRTASDSIGLGFEDTPYVHLYVLPADTRPPPAPPGNDSPTPAWLAVAALGAVAAAAARRRR